MKNFITVLTLFLTALFSNAQTQFDYLGAMPVNANITGCFFMDLNTFNTNTGENDVKLAHGNGSIYFASIYSDSAFMPSNNDGFWLDCSGEMSFNSERAYIIKDGITLTKGSHVLPFTHSNKIHYLVIEVISNELILIRGWVFNIDPDEFECYELTDLELGLQEHSIYSQKYTDYNEIGQPINEYYSGFVIRVYSNGQIIKTYKK